MRRTVRVIFAALLAVTLLASTLFPAASPPVLAQAGPRTFQPVPDEVIALFENGMSVDEFLAMNAGKDLGALQTYLDRPVSVVIEMENPSLAAFLAQSAQTPEQVPALTQQSYTSQLAQQQAAVVSTVSAAGGTVLGRYTKVYNGVLARVPAKSISVLRAQPGVKAVHRAPKHYPLLTKSVPLIRADAVWNSSTPYTGQGIRIAIIDTGIDYTHAAFGGPGTEEAYDDNDPDVIEEDTFPTTKVIGGYDFAGTDYTGENIPEEDPDPLDENGHGTHVASTAAGMEVPASLIGKGVAPDALLYALKVFGADGGTEITINALEWAMDPNGDNDVSDRVNVINMSLGSDFGPDDEAEPMTEAIANLSSMGVVVVASSGNSGNISYITGSPANASTAISVAASGTGWLTAPYVEVTGSDVQVPYKQGGFMGNTGTVDDDITGTLAYVGNLTGAEDDQLCTTEDLEADALDGKIALIQRGTCSFSVKINNAAELGAVAAIVFNDEARGDVLISMGDPTTAVQIPSLFIGHTAGVAMAAQDGVEVTIWASKIQQFPYGEEDLIADFTSMGPRGYDSILKPDVTAPGVEIFAAEMGSGNEGISFSGTSMAAPHIAGVAALMRQAHPDWTAESIKAAIMNTSVELPDVPVSSQGAGRVDALAAVQTDTLVVAEPGLVTLNWGLVEIETNQYSNIQNVELRNLGSESKTYNVTAAITNPEPEGASVTVEGSVTVGPNSTTAVPIRIDLDATQIPLGFREMEEYSGFITFTNAADSEDVLRLPFFLVPRPYTRLTQQAALTMVDLEQEGFNMGFIELEQSGPQPSNLWPMAAYVVDTNETEQRNAGDLRMVGVDYVADPLAGEIVLMGFSMWGPVHAPLHYFVSLMVLMDVDDDGAEDFINFNYNLGAVEGPNPNNDWVVLQMDAETSEISLASPFLVFSDYNAAYQEWALPPSLNRMGDVDEDPDTEDESEFTFQTYAYDFLLNEDESEPATVDYLRIPFTFAINTLEPHNSRVRLEVYVDPETYESYPPKGVMLIDIFGKPGADQALYWPILVPEGGVHRLYMPVINPGP